MIVKYKVELDDKRHPFLVRESVCCYENSKLDGAGKIVDMMNECFNLCNMAEEYVYMVALNSAAVPVGVFEVSHGCINSTLLNPRELYLRAGRISAMISPGFSVRGLSVVTMTKSAQSAAALPMRGRLVRSRSPPQPKRATVRPLAKPLTVESTLMRLSEVWA